MGTSLSGLTPATTFDGLLKVGDNDPLTADLKAISTGDGTDTMLELSTTALQIGGATGMYWDNTNKRLGIATDAPSVPLEVYGDVRFRNNLNVNGNLTNSSTGEVNINNLGFFDVVSGNVGIGESIPTSRLHIKGSGADDTTTSLLVQNGDGTQLLKISDDGDINMLPNLKTLTIGSRVNSLGGQISISPNNQSSIVWQGSNGTMYISGRGKGIFLGDVATTPTARLHVKGEAPSGTPLNNPTALLVQNSDGADMVKVTDDGITTLGTTGQQGEINLARASDGVVIGKIQGTTNGLYLTNQDGTNHMLIGTSSAKGVSIGGGLTSQTGASFSVKGSGNDNTTTSLLVQNSTGTELFKVQDDGRVDFASLYASGTGIYGTNPNFKITIESGQNVYSTYGNHSFRVYDGVGYNAAMHIVGNGVSPAVGIGETTPTAKLHVKAGTTLDTIARFQDPESATSYLDIKQESGTFSTYTALFYGTDPKIRSKQGGRLYLESSNEIRFTTGVVVNTIFDETGSVAHGSNSLPANTRAYIKGSGDTSATTALLVQNSAGTDMLRIMDGGADKVLRTSSAQIGSLEFVGENIGRGGGNPITFAGTNQIGIGVSTPTSKLHIQGSGNDNTTTALLVQNSDGTDMLSVKDDLSVVFNSTITSASSTLRFDVGGTGTIRMNSDKVAIGGNTTPTARLHVKGSGNTSADYALKILNSDDSTLFDIRNDSVIRIAPNSTNAVSFRNAKMQDGNAVFGTTTIPASTRLTVKGQGASSGTTALLVQNSDGVDLLRVRDDGASFLNGQLTTTGAITNGTLLMNSSRFQIGSTGNGALNFSNNGLAYQDDNVPTQDASAAFQVNSTRRGFLPPRMTDAERDAIATPAAGLMIYDTTNNQMNYWNGSTWIAF